MRVAVIGLGAIGPLHVSSIVSIYQNLVALCDTDLSKCEKMDSDFNIQTNHYSNYIEMFEKENLDSVHICTPHYLHKEMIVEALKRNINVLCEKPLCISYEQLDEIEKAVKSSKAFLGVNLQNRFNESIFLLKNSLKIKRLLQQLVTLYGKEMKHIIILVNGEANGLLKVAV